MAVTLKAVVAATVAAVQAWCTIRAVKVRGACIAACSCPIRIAGAGSVAFMAVTAGSVVTAVRTGRAVWAVMPQGAVDAIRATEVR